MKPLNPRVAGVVPRADRTLDLTFTNGEVRRFDVNPLLGYPVFQHLREGSEFVQVRIDHGTVVWRSGVDLCPDTLYERSEPI